MKKSLNQFFFGTSLSDNNLLNIGWLIFRVQIGLSIAVHAGLPKLENGLAPGWFVNQVSGLGFNFPSPTFWAAIAVWGEFAGGILIALGLLTRFSALQLAFQFFVISFLWYDNPEPFTGMYFQHSLFWGFVLVSFLGGGKFSIDKLIMNRKMQVSLLTPKTVVASSLLFFVCLGSQAQAPITVNIKDFKNAEGEWKGTLTYLDYTSGKPYTMDANITVNKSDQNHKQLIFAFNYPDEPKANGKDTLTISVDGSMIDNEKIISREDKNGELKIVTETNGIDGNDHKKAIIRHIYIISAKAFIKRKEVKFDVEDKFIMRNEFKMSR